MYPLLIKYVGIPLVLALLALGGKMYINHLQTQRDFYKAQALGYKKLGEIATAREKIRKGTEEVTHDLDQKGMDGDSAGVSDYFNRLSKPSPKGNSAGSD